MRRMQTEVSKDRPARGGDLFPGCVDERAPIRRTCVRVLNVATSHEASSTSPVAASSTARQRCIKSWPAPGAGSPAEGASSIPLTLLGASDIAAAGESSAIAA